MNPVRRQRLIILLFITIGVGIAITLAMFALRQNINLFYAPVQIQAGEAVVGQKIRLGGLVVPGSIVREPHSLTVHFKVTDNLATVSVVYKGMLPDLFREGSGVVALGQLESSGIFRANQILAKHDEKYMPPEVRKAVVNLHDAQKKQASDKDIQNKNKGGGKLE